MVHLEMEHCKDYPIIRNFFCENTLNLFEEQLRQYLKMEEITEEYLQRVPPVVCWYEGMIATEEFIEEYGEVNSYGIMWNEIRLCILKL